MAGYGRATYWASESLRPTGTAADVVIRADFFGAQGAAPPVDITATGAWTQAAQALVAAGNIVIAITGTATLSQVAQVLAAAGEESLSGIVALAQQAQSLAASGTESFVASGTWNQVVQSFLGNAAESFTGIGAFAQSVQSADADGEEVFEGAAILIAAAQEILAEGSHEEAPPISSFFGEMTLTQALQILSASGDTPVMVAPKWRGPMRRLSSQKKYKLYVRGRKRI